MTTTICSAGDNGHPSLNDLISNKKVIQMVNSMGSTFILTADHRLIVFGNNQYNQLHLSFENIAQSIWNNILSHSSQPIPSRIVSLIDRFSDNAIKKYCNAQKNTARHFLCNSFTKPIKFLSNGIASKHSFVMTQNNELYGSGWNGRSQINTYHRKHYTVGPVTCQCEKILFFGARNIKIIQIACAATYSSFLSSTGNVYVRGQSEEGGLGLYESIRWMETLEHFRAGQTDSIQLVATLKHVKICMICNGDDHSLALDENGNVWSWGWNYFNQLGPRDCNETFIPKKITKYQCKFTQISCGCEHSMLLDSNGKIYAFGRNDEYQCGQNEAALNEIDGRVIDIKCGYNHSVVKTEKNDFYLFGWNNFNQCLVYDVNVHFVKIPTKFNDNSIGKVLAMYPGFQETRVVTQR